MTDLQRRATGGAIAAMIALLVGCTPLAPTAPTEVAAEGGEVVAVVDGDTIDVALPAGVVRVRLIGIDTPEIGRRGEQSECYAEEARAFLDQLLYGRHVELRTDPSQATADRYGRLLRNVLVDGQSAALAAITAGAGREYTYDTAYVDQDAHLEAEQKAAGAHAGLWGACG